MANLEDSDDYKREHSQYIAATAVADRTNDANAKLQAELDWERTKNRLEKEFAASVLAEERLKAVHAEIKEKYPAVPESLIKSVTDPEMLLTLAKEISDKIGAGDWGAPGGAPGGSGSAKSNSRKERNELIDRVNRGDPQAATEFKRGIIADKVIPFIERQRGGGNNAA